MKEMTLKKIILITVCTLLLSALCIAGSGIYAGYRMNLVRTVVAARDILPRTEITADDLMEIEVPASYLMDACTSANEVIGRYTEIQGMIPAGSPIYRSMIFDSAELPDQPVLQLKDGQAVYTLETDLSGAGILTAGQRVDVHVSVEREYGVPVTGNILNHVRIIAVKDHKGLPLDDEESTGVPFLVLLAVDRSDIDLLNIAGMTGEIRIFASSDAYETDTEAERADTSPVLNYLTELMADAGQQDSEKNG